MNEALTAALAALEIEANNMSPNAKGTALKWIHAVRAGKQLPPDQLQGTRKITYIQCPGKLAFPPFPAYLAAEQSASYLRMNWKQPAARQFADCIQKFGIVIVAD